jgi:hypothetical protein
MNKNLIGKKYKYPNSEKIFVIKSIANFHCGFYCGHWCTDNVFVDLINIETGIAKWQQPTKVKKLKLF